MSTTSIAAPRVRRSRSQWLVRIGRSLPVIVAIALTSPPALAAQAPRRPLHVDPSLKDCSVIFAPSLTQGAFRRFVREFGSVSAFKQGAPAATLARGRVMLDVELMRFSVDEWSDAWHDTFAHPDADHTLGSDNELPKLRARVGITDDLDVGVYFTSNLQANYGWLGVDGKYRVVRPTARRPVSVAVRGAYTKTLRVSDMDMHAVTADVSIDRTFRGGLRPYVGVGGDVILARETSAAVSLHREVIVAPHALAGVDYTIGRVNIGAEAAAAARPTMHFRVGVLAF